MPTPLYDALKTFAGENPLRMHMPGHKGKPLPCPELAAVSEIDFTELPPTGNLFEQGEPFTTAQTLWAEKFGFDNCQFLTGGSTMGIHTGMALCCPVGSQVLVDRCCHRAVFNALALLDLEPVYLERPWLEAENLIGPFSAEHVEKMLDKHPNIKTVCITSPTYAGLLSDIEGISPCIHARGGKLMVDGAHGAHLPFLGVDAFSGADVVVVSAHKTLPALGQGALLFTNGFDRDLVARRATLYGTSSPSYPILASLDLARDWMETHTDEYRRVANWVAKMREMYPSLWKVLSIDPTRFTLTVKDGPGFTKKLEKLGIYPEMEDGGHVVFILTGLDSDEDLLRLENALFDLREDMGNGEKIPSPPLPEMVLSPRQALFAQTENRPLKDCEGLISAAQVAPYPPGVPVVAPGERISKKELAYLTKIGYNINLETQVIAQTGE